MQYEIVPNPQPHVDDVNYNLRITNGGVSKLFPITEDECVCLYCDIQELIIYPAHEKATEAAQSSTTPS